MVFLSVHVSGNDKCAILSFGADQGLFLTKPGSGAGEKKMGLGQNGNKKRHGVLRPKYFFFIFRDLLFKSRASISAMSHQSKSAPTKIIKETALSKAGPELLFKNGAGTNKAGVPNVV